MGRYDGFLQGLQVGGSLGNTILDHVAAKDRLALGEKELAQRADLAAQDQAIRAMHYQQIMGSQQQQQELARQKMLEDAMRYKMTQARELAGLNPAQLDQYNAALGAFHGGQQQPQMPQPSNAKIKVNSRGITYDGTVADAMMDAQNPVLGPILQQSVKNTMASQAPQQSQVPGQVPISPLAMEQYQRQAQMQDSEAMLKQQGMMQNMQQAQAAQLAKEAELRAGLAKMEPQQAEVYNAMMQQSPTQNSLLPGQVPVLRGKSNGVLPSGSAKLTDTAAGKLANALQVKDSIDRISNSYDVLNQQGKTGPIAGRFFGIGREFQPEMQQLQAQLIATIPGLARGVFGEVGVLTDKDVERYTKVLPNELASPETAKRLFDDLRRKVDGTIASQLETYGRAGYNVGEFEPIYSAIKGAGTSAASNPAQSAAGGPQDGAIIEQDGARYMYRGGQFVPVQ